MTPRRLLVAAAAVALAAVMTAPAESAQQSSTDVKLTRTSTGKVKLKKRGWMGKKVEKAVDSTQLAILDGSRTQVDLVNRTNKLLFPPKPPAPTERIFMGFEEAADMEWITDGYVDVSWAAEHATQGTRSLRAVFLLPADLAPNASGSWRPAMRLEAIPRGTKGKLKEKDWSAYPAIRFDCFTPGDQPVDLVLALTDSHGFRFEAARRVPAGGATVFDVPMDTIRAGRLDVTSISIVELAVDTTSLKARPIVYIDNVRFALPVPPTPPEPAAAGAAVPAASLPAAATGTTAPKNTVIMEVGTPLSPAAPPVTRTGTGTPAPK